MWFGQDWPTTVLLPSQGTTALNRTVFVLPAALEVIPETCGLAKTGPEPVLLPSQSKQLWTEPLLCFQWRLKWFPKNVLLPRLAQNGITSKSEQNSFEQNRFCVFSGVNKGNSRNMWFGQDWPRTGITFKSEQAALNRTAFVFPVTLKSNSKKMRFCQDWPRTVLLPSQGKQL